MKAISLWQPWASLMAIGAKQIETRSWATGYRGRVAIHAAKRWTEEEADLCCHNPYCSVLGAHFKISAADAPAFRYVLPFGAIIAVGYLVDIVPTAWCRKSIFVPSGYRVERNSVKGYRYLDSIYLSEKEYAFGNYEPWRFAWLFQDVTMLDKPIPYKGMQGLFEVPEGVVS